MWPFTRKKKKKPVAQSSAGFVETAANIATSNDVEWPDVIGSVGSAMSEIHKSVSRPDVIVEPDHSPSTDVPLEADNETSTCDCDCSCDSDDD